jgi:hypothetical protein
MSGFDHGMAPSRKNRHSFAPGGRATLALAGFLTRPQAETSNRRNRETVDHRAGLVNLADSPLVEGI